MTTPKMLVATIKTNIAAMIVSRNDPDLNRQFHATLYPPSNLPFDLAMPGNAMGRLDRYLRAQRLPTDDHARGNAEYSAIACAGAMHCVCGV